MRELLKFDAVIAEVEEELLPNRLCSYLFELSQVFNRFYDQVPVLKADSEALASRLALCRLTADTLRLGLAELQLGIGGRKVAPLAGDTGDAHHCIEEIGRRVALQRQHPIKGELVIGDPVLL